MIGRANAKISLRFLESFLPNRSQLFGEGFAGVMVPDIDRGNICWIATSLLPGIALVNNRLVLTLAASDFPAGEPGFPFPPDLGAHWQTARIYKVPNPFGMDLRTWFEFDWLAGNRPHAAGGIGAIFKRDGLDFLIRLDIHRK